MKLGLESITRLLTLLGEPQNKFPAVLVGGTNGKGSVTTFISSILRNGGLGVGAFYSPHIFRVNERIRINGEEIPSPVLDEILGRLKKLYDKVPFTFFEGVTAAAVLYFVRRKVDVAVFEVGLGGRLDATRLVNAAVTVITGISHDHREHLGRTNTRILKEKLGITRRGIPLVANLGTRALVETVRRSCRADGVPFHNVNEETDITLKSLEPEGMVLRLVTPERDYGNLGTVMIGRVQNGNIATAVRTVEILGKVQGDSSGGARFREALEGTLRPAGRRGSRSKGFKERFGVKAVKDGVHSAFLAGRFQVLPGAPRIILDVSHNEEALLAALDTLRALSLRGRNVMIFGVLAHKELGKFPGRAIGSAREIILTPLNNRRSARVEDLLDLFTMACRKRGSRAASIMVAGGMREAVRTARKLLCPEDTLLILGSHLAVEEAAAWL